MYISPCKWQIFRLELFPDPKGKREALLSDQDQVKIHSFVKKKIPPHKRQISPTVTQKSNYTIYQPNYEQRWDNFFGFRRKKMDVMHNIFFLSCMMCHNL